LVFYKFFLLYIFLKNKEEFLTKFILYKKKLFFLILFYYPQTGNSDDKMKTAFQIYDVNNDGFITNGDLFNILKILVGDNLTNIQLQQLVDRTLIAADKDMDGRISFEEFCEYCKDMKIAEMFSMKIF